MNRRRSLLLATLVLVAAAGCGLASAGPKLPEVKGEYGAKPTVEIPSSAPPDEPVVKELLTGHGRPVMAGEAVVANVAIWTWSRTKPYLDTFRSKQPTTAVLDGKHVSRTWDTALVGQRAGSRVLLVAPAKVGFGPQGAPANVEPNDTLVVVFDVLGSYRRSHGEPTVKIPTAEPPAKLRQKVTATGTGFIARPGDTVVLHYTALTWRDRAVFDSSYRRSAPNGFVLADGAVPPGWVGALDGLRAGSSVLIAVPEAQNRGFTATTGGLAVPAGTAVYYRLDLLDVVR